MVEKSKPVFLYALKEPGVDGRIRYIGKTVDCARRLQNHIVASKTRQCHRANWIQFLLRRGLRPELEMLAQIPEQAWKYWEVEYISAFKDLGYDLVNGTLGGDGFCAGEEHPYFGKPAWNRGKPGPPAWNKGKPMSAEARAKMSVSQTGKKRSSESIAKRAAKLIGWKQSLAARAKVSAAQKGVKESPATCAATSARQLGKRQSLETIAKRVAKNTGKKRTPEQRARMSEAAFRRSKRFPPEEKK